MDTKKKYDIQDLLGKTFGRLTVVGEGYEIRKSRKNRTLLCTCSCGNTKEINLIRVVRGECKSCGCGRELIAESHRHNTEICIDIFRSVHGTRYNYSLVDYKDNISKVKVICELENHGIFEVTPGNHKSGVGCPKCYNRGYNPLYSGHLYILESDNLTKIGITNKSVAARCNNINKYSENNFHVVYTFFFENGCKAFQVEQELLCELRRKFERPTQSFDGSTECFYELDAKYLKHLIQEKIKEL